MMYSTRILTGVLVAVLFVTTITASLSCPPAFKPKGNSCVCADWPEGIITCDNGSQKARLLSGYCMTYNDETGEISAGACRQSYFRNDSFRFYYPLPTTIIDLNNQMCDPFNAKGLLCGKCQDGFAISPFATIYCVNCTNTSNDWIKYLALAYLPIAVIFTIVIVFSISFVSGPINSFIFFAQITALPFRGSFSTVASVLGSQGTHRFSRRMSTTVITALYDVLNLNIFHDFMPPICLTNHFSRLQAYATDYGLGFFPLILVVILFICIQLHARNFRPIVWCWKPFLKCFFYFRRSVDPKTSAIDAFATFTLLSYVKLLFTAGKFVIFQYVYHNGGKLRDSVVMAYSTDIQFFCKDHLPFAIFSIFVLLTFIAVPPIVLLFYPTSLFQKCLTRCKMNSQALRTFVETFQGCYKDGTNGTRNYQYFAGLFFILRIIAITLISLSVQNYLMVSTLLYWFIALLFALVQPYKNHFHNVVDAVMFALMGTIFFLFIFSGLQTVLTGYTYEFLLVLVDMLYTLPFLYLVLFIACWVLNRKLNLFQKLNSRVFVHCCLHNNQREEFDAAIPHRLLNPEEYGTPTHGSQVEYELANQ